MIIDGKKYNGIVIRPMNGANTKLMEELDKLFNKKMTKEELKEFRDDFIKLKEGDTGQEWLKPYQKEIKELFSDDSFPEFGFRKVDEIKQEKELLELYKDLNIE